MVEQMAVFMENRQGRITELTKILKENGVDLITLSIADTKDFGILRCITSDNAKAEKVLRSAGFAVTATGLIGVGVEDRPGCLAEVLALLDSADINIEYLYSFRSAAAKTAVILFKVSDEKRAVEILTKNKIKLLDNSVI